MRNAPLPPAVFLPFDRSPPDMQTCLGRVYDVFSHHAIVWNWCPQCFGPAWEQRMHAHPDIRTAPRSAFEMIYFEHPDCSGGAATFLHWLPRGLELSFFDHRLTPDFTAQMFRLGLLAWPEDETAALRQFFCRAAVNWFTHGDHAPLEITGAQNVGLRLAGGLLALGIEAGAIGTWLAESGTPAARRTLLDVLRTEQILEASYIALADPELKTLFDEARAALERCTRDAFHTCVTRALLTQEWQADTIREAELLIGTSDPIQSSAQRAADEAAIAKAMAADIKTGAS